MQFIIRWLGSFMAALRFLTILPLPGQLGTTERELAGGLPFFPLIGLLIGCLTVPVSWGMYLLFPPLVTALLATLILLAFSGGLHLDGLADTADGFFSARPRERILEIMRDSATGAMGVTALIMLLLLKVICLGSMSGKMLIFSVFLMPIAGRTAILLLMALLPYVRVQGGLGTLFYSRKSRLTAVWSLLFFAAMAWFTGGIRGAVAVLAVVLLTLLFALFCHRKINGATGDTLGAVCELSEAAVALVFAAQYGGA